ncbi:MAG: FIST C-terminal domain-containing protein [Myxococcales bacterium]|nr:FIST C-terminal domain-containing protein [Myxococcales bacterium]
MRSKQWVWTKSAGWPVIDVGSSTPSIVLVFGGREALEAGDALTGLARHVPRELLFGCSTAGEIEGSSVHDGAVVATALWLERSTIVATCAGLSEAPDTTSLGRLLAQRLPASDLVHALVLSDGTQVNGSELVRGLIAGLPRDATLSGGLSGDGVDMKRTVVVHAGAVKSGCVSLIGFGGGIRVATGSRGGWDAFGPSRAVTKARGNVLEELDGEPALALYKRYLGPHAAALPSSALLFPLVVKTNDGSAPVVRTVLGVDEAAGTMTFAGDVPMGSSAQLMRANFERIIAAGEGAAEASRGTTAPEFALLISCVGRKLILKQRTEEELEAVRSVLGADTTTTGFYSYGELAPGIADAPCQLHNQTMTVTTFWEP